MWMRVKAGTTLIMIPRRSTSTSNTDQYKFDKNLGDENTVPYNNSVQQNSLYSSFGNTRKIKEIGKISNINRKNCFEYLL